MNNHNFLVQLCALVQNFGNDHLVYRRAYHLRLFSWMVTGWSWMLAHIDSRFFLFGWLWPQRAFINKKFMSRDLREWLWCQNSLLDFLPSSSLARGSKGNEPRKPGPLLGYLIVKEEVSSKPRELNSKDFSKYSKKSLRITVRRSHQGHLALGLYFRVVNWDSVRNWLFQDPTVCQRQRPN